MTTGTVYGLHCECDYQSYRYVGQTTRTAEKRLEGHIYRTFWRESGKDPVHNWIRKHSLLGHFIHTTVLEVCTIDELNDRELFWIAGLIDQGYKLTNCNAAHPIPASDATRAKISAGLRGRPMPETAREALLRANRGRKLSEEHKRKVGEAGRGRKHSEEAKKKIGDAHRGKTMSAEARSKLSAAKKGKPGHVWRPESIEKLRQSMTGKKHQWSSDEMLDQVSKYRKTVAIKSNHVRWHVNAGKPPTKPCIYCEVES